MTRIIAQMVARNEEGRYLEEVLKHLKTVVDDIVFTDDCSDDNTMEIASKYTDKVYRTSENLFTKHEGQLRTEAWANLCKHAEPGDWILAIDADEKLYCDRPNVNLSKLINHPDYDVINIRFYHMWDEKRYRIDKAWKPGNSSRLFKFYRGGKFPDRRLACGSEPHYVNALIRRRRYLVNSGLIMAHLGYIRDEDKRSKYERYMTLDHGDYHSLEHIKSIIDENPVLVEWKI